MLSDRLKTIKQQQSLGYIEGYPILYHQDLPTSNATYPVGTSQTAIWFDITQTGGFFQNPTTDYYQVRFPMIQSDYMALSIYFYFENKTNVDIVSNAGYGTWWFGYQGDLFMDAGKTYLFVKSAGSNAWNRILVP